MTLVDEQLKSPESSNSHDNIVQVLKNEYEIDGKGREYTYRKVHVEDVSDDNPELRDLFTRQGDLYEQVLRSNLQWKPTVTRSGEVIIDENNEAARWLYYNEDGTEAQLLEWAKRFPTAIALEPLQRLEKGGRWLKDGKLDERSLTLFTYMADAIGLRSRAGIYSQRLVEYAQESGVKELSILSLGSGAAVPNIQATQALEANNTAVHWKFYDFDPEALMFAQQLIEENKFRLSTFDYGPEWVNPETGNAEPKGQNYLRAFGAEDESADIVDALGLWEYLKPKDAVRFAQALYKKVKPGGSLIVSNMLPSRPQRQFNQRAVGWPGLYMRNDSELLDIVTEAGIDSSLVTMTHAQDGVYVVMEIKKP
jgi:hypothetical protein